MTPYNTSRNVVDRMKLYLDMLKENSDDVLFFEHSDPAKLHYAIREVLFAVKLHADCAQYHDLRDKYTLSLKPTGVECRRKENVRGERVALEPHKIGRVHVPEVVSLAGVLGAAIRFEAAGELVFANAALSKADKVKLFNWCNEHDCGFIDMFDAGITIVREGDVDPDLFYSPED